MTPIVFITMGALVTLSLLAYGLRRQGQGVRLRTRLAALTPDAEFAHGGEADSKALERLFLCTGKDREEVVTALRGAGYYAPKAVVTFAAIRFFSTLVVGLAVFVVVRTGSHPGRAVTYGLVALAATFLVSKMI